MSWNPQQYLKFGGERIRPAIDLLARVDLSAPENIADLGCGTGSVTALIRQRWPDADIVGVDNSTAMLERARAALPDVTFQAADIATWSPAQSIDLLVSNAALQWLDNHQALFPRLISLLGKGGVLAVQMPSQQSAPSHRIGIEQAQSARWRAQLGSLVRRPIPEPAEYYAILRPLVTKLDMWSTEYVQMLKGDHPVAEFTKGSFVGAWLSALSAEDARVFEADYRSAVAKAYPKLPDGTTLFPFRRFFLIAKR